MDRKRMRELSNMNDKLLKEEKLTQEEKKYLQNGVDSAKPLNYEMPEISKEEKEQNRKALLDIIDKYYTNK